MTTNWMDVTEPKDFIQQLLEESTSASPSHIIMIKSHFSHVNLFRIAQISAATPGTVPYPEK